MQPPPLAGANDPAFDPNPPPDGWWRLYGNPVLDGLIDQALRRNTDLRAALASLDQARAQLRGAERERTPQTMAMVNPTYAEASADDKALAQEPPPSIVFTAGEMLDYNVDVAGRLRRQIEAARAQVGAQAAALDLARTTVAAETATGYSTVCATGLEIVVTNRSIAIAHNSQYIVERFFTAGIAAANDVVRARTQAEQTQAMLPSLVAQNRSALYMLATLTGDPPEQVPPGVAGCTAPPALRMPIPGG